MSVTGSLPSTCAAYSRRSLSLTVTCLASRTTWALVSTRPSGLMTKPETLAAERLRAGVHLLRQAQARDAAEEAEERVVVATRCGALLRVFIAGLVQAGHRDADDGRALRLHDGAVVGHLGRWQRRGGCRHEGGGCCGAGRQSGRRVAGRGRRAGGLVLQPGRQRPAGGAGRDGHAGGQQGGGRGGQGGPWRCGSSRTPHAGCGAAG